ncbi:UNVERIFIED_CONTAM: hypothetical protein FKN15_036942 [Acipenser sinensis]
MPLAKDLMHPLAEVERQKHKKKRLVQSPNSYFMDVKCPGCYRITTVFSHAQRVVPCGGCSYVLCQPKGGKCRLTEGWKSSLRIILCSSGPLVTVYFLSGSFKKRVIEIHAFSAVFLHLFGMQTLYLRPFFPFNIIIDLLPVAQTLLIWGQVGS